LQLQCNQACSQLIPRKLAANPERLFVAAVEICRPVVATFAAPKFKGQSNQELNINVCQLATQTLVLYRTHEATGVEVFIMKEKEE